MATAQKLADIKAQIAELQKRAEEIVQAEKASLIEDMKSKIADYGITASDLGFVVGGAKTAVKSSSSKTKAVAKYKNNQGETWSGGRGPKPKWVKEILDAGGDIEKYRI
jgi:DNA-binding protein H-NS